ncbi:MAG TPA: FKBP-type peptidyl-prolyl cis-trans isomerase [Candidatus Avibacteroides faecavium]|nr:FKBP-type peptidyl-prolyl cis-trans isomerase [Candidatus Avibacteroides faecavium]
MVLKQRLAADFDLDSTHYDAFVKGLAKGAECYDMDDVAEALGFYHGLLVRKERMEEVMRPMLEADSTLAINRPLFLDVLEASFLNDSLQMSQAQVGDYMTSLQKELQTKALEKQKADNAAFLADNAKRDSVVTTDSGLQYKVLVAGKGKVASMNSKVKVNYRGTTIDGVEFDSSYKRGVPAEFTPGQVIKGWTEALMMMPAGSKWMLYIPYDLAYGERGAGPIKPYSTLIFELEVLEVED